MVFCREICFDGCATHFVGKLSDKLLSDHLSHWTETTGGWELAVSRLGAGWIYALVFVLLIGRYYVVHKRR